MTVEFVVNLENHKRRIWSICWSPDGNFLASVGADKYITIWIKTNKDKIKKTSESSKVWKKFKMFGEGTHKSGSIKFDIYDIIETNHEKSLRHIEFSRDGSFFVVASFDSKCSIYKKNNNDKWVFYKSLEGHEKEVKCASIHPTNKYIVTCGRDKSIWIHAKTDEVNQKDDEQVGSTANAEETPTNGVQNEEQVKEDSQNAAQTDAQCNNQGEIQPNTESQKSNNHLDVDFDFNFDAYLTGHSEDIKFVSWCPLSENTFISLSYDNSLKIWNKQISEWSCIQTLNEHTSVVWCVAFNFDGSEFATCSDDKSIRIWKSEKKVWYNKNKYPFLYEHVVKEGRKLSNESSLCSLINKPNSTIGDSATGVKKVLANDSRGYSNHNSKSTAYGKGSNERNFLDKTAKLFRKIRKPMTQGGGEKASDVPSNFSIIDYSKEDKEVKTALKVVVQNNFVPLYFEHGLFKYVYKYSDMEGGKQGAFAPVEASAEKREDKGADPEKESPSGAHLIAKNEPEDAPQNETKNELNDQPKDQPKDDECISKVSKDGVDQPNTQDADMTHKEEENEESKLSNEEKTNIQSGCTTTQEEQQTSNPVSENVSSVNIIPNLSDKEKDLNNVSFDDWKIKHVIEGYHKRSISYLDWNAYEDLIAASSFDNSLKIFQKKMDTWNLIENIENAHLSDVNCVVWCPQKYQDYFLLATAGDDCVINIWKYTKG